MPSETLGRERRFLIDINNSTTVAGEKWIQVAMQEGGSLDRSVETTSTTNKQNFGFKTQVGVEKGWSASWEGFDSSSNVGLIHIAEEWGAELTTDVRLHIGLFTERGFEVGHATLTSFSLTFPTNEPAKYSISLEGYGNLNRRQHTVTV